MSVRLPGQSNVYAYRRGPKRTRAKPNDDPEHRLQVAVAVYLMFALPKEYLWTANVSGMRGSIYQGVKAKAAGLKKGWPDIQILGPGGGVRFVELKAKDGDLSPEQKAFMAHCIRTGLDMHAVCRSPEDVEAALLRWRIPIKVPLARASRYAQGDASE